MKKRVLSLILAVMLTVSIIPFTGITTLASDPPAITEAELQAKFATLRSKLENKYFTVNQTYCRAAPGEAGHPPQNDCSNCKNTNVYNASWFPLMTPQDHPENMPKHYCPGGGYITSVGWSCAGFATYAQWYLYASQPGDYVVAVKKGGDISLNYNNLKSVDARVGDVLRSNDGHSVVLYSYNSSGLSYIQCNGTRINDGNCKVTYKSNISYSEFTSAFGGTVCVTGCKNFSSTPTTYTISYNANGGSGAPGNQTKTHGTNLTLSSTKPTRDGYTFLGWATSAGATSAAYQPGGTYSANAAVTLYAVWKINTYTVAYNANGGSGAPGNQTKTYGTNLTLSTTTPTRTGYAFQGWATSASATSANYQPGATYSNNANVTLYAVWKGCIVWSDWSTTKPSSGEYETATQYRYRDKIIKKSGSSSESGYTLAQSSPTLIGTTNGAWQPTAPSTPSGVSGEYYYDRSVESKTAYYSYFWYSSSQNSFWCIKSNDTYKDYVKIYSASVGTGVAEASPYQNYKYVTAGKTVTIGSKDSQLGEIYYISNNDSKVNSYTTPRANLLPYQGGTATIYRTVEKKYQYTHYKWGDWSGWSTTAVSGNDNREVQTRTVYRYKVSTQHSFGGWTKTKDPTCTATGTQTRKCSVCGTVETGSIAALGHSYGAWVNDVAAGVRRRTCSRCTNVETETYFYNISYNANGGSGAPSAQTKTKDAALTLSSAKPTREGYTFQGWATSANAASAAYQPGGSYTSNAAVTLYAIWKANTYRIQYNLDGGSFEHEPGGMYEWIQNTGANITQQINPMITCYDGFYNGSNIDSFTVEEPTKEGYTFVGWEITGMDNCNHYYWDKVNSKSVKFSTDSFSIPGNNGNDFRNLRSTDGLVTFTAKWESTHTHNYAEAVTKGATCTEDGVKTFTCVCGDTYTETIKATGHKNTIFITELKPTCTKPGAEDEYCLDCSDLVGTREIPALGHDDSGEWIVEKAATCTENGSKALYCKRCTEKIDTVSITALGHNFVLAEKNEKHPHNELYKCTRCPETKTVAGVYSEICPECNFTSTVIDAQSCKITGYTGELSSLTVPAELGGKKVVSTATSALKANAKLTEVRFEDGITEIGSLTFMNCSSLKKAVLPASVTTIGTYAFYGCAADFAIYCFRDSYAHQYAVDNNIDFVLMDIAETKNSIIDYTHKLIFTQFTMAADMSVLIGVPKNVVAIPQASVVNGNRETFGTGSTVTVFENNTFSGEYTVIVNGDLDGDGVSDVLDAILAERAANGHATLSDAQAYAANNSADTEIDAASYQNVVNRALGA